MSIPSGEMPRLEFLQRFSTMLSNDGTNHGFTAAETNAIFTAVDNLNTAIAGHHTARDAARAARIAKLAAEEAALELVRPAIRRLQAAAGMTDELRLQYGLSVADTTPSAPVEPLSAPVGVLDIGERFTHVLRVFDSANPARRAKPRGVEGCEVWLKIGAEPAHPDELQFAGVHKNHRFVRQFTAAELGQKAYYMLRWFNSRGERGPWSETISGTIAA